MSITFVSGESCNGLIVTVTALNTLAPLLLTIGHTYHCPGDDVSTKAKGKKGSNYIIRGILRLTACKL